MRLWLVLVMAVTCSGVARSESPEFVVGSLGDSISTGFNAIDFGNNFDLSWSTGSKDKVKSHFLKLKNKFGKEVTVTAINRAVAGAKVADVVKQSTDLATSKPSYVTLLIGANDVCSWSDDYKGQLAQFEKNLVEVIDQTIAANQDVKILVSSLPDMNRLYEIGKKKCQFKWDVFGICKPLLSSKQTDEGRRRFAERVMMVNQTLEKVAYERKGNALFDPVLGTYQFADQHISSIDCFHPSVDGQTAISEETWTYGWYKD